MSKYAFFFMTVLLLGIALSPLAYARSHQARQDNVFGTPPSEDHGSVYFGEDAQGNTVMRAIPREPEPEPEQPIIPYIIPEIRMPPLSPISPGLRPPPPGLRPQPPGLRPQPRSTR